MPQIGPMEIAIVLRHRLLVLGPKRLPAEEQPGLLAVERDAV